MDPSYGNILKEIRIKNKKTQTDIALLIDKTTMYISNIENGKNGPLDGADLDTILGSLGVSEHDVVRLKSKALLEGAKVSNDLLKYLKENPVILEFLITLCLKNIDGTESKIIKQYYERIRKNYV